MPAEDARQALRAKHQVRLLSEQEEALGIHRLPNGVYGFTWSAGQKDAPLYRVAKYRTFEVHKLADGTVVLVGFVTAEAAAQIETAREQMRIQLSAQPQGEATTLAGIPAWRISKLKEHSARESGALELQLEPA